MLALVLLFLVVLLPLLVSLLHMMILSLVVLLSYFDDVDGSVAFVCYGISSSFVVFLCEKCILELVEDEMKGLITHVKLCISVVVLDLCLNFIQRIQYLNVFPV